MEFQKIVNFLDTISNNKDLPKFVNKKWIEVYTQSERNYNPNKEIRITTSMLKWDLCEFSDALLKEILLLLKKNLLLMILKHQIIQQLMQMLLILQMIMHLVKRNWFLKIMHHLSIVFQKLMV